MEMTFSKMNPIRRARWIAWILSHQYTVNVLPSGDLELSNGMDEDNAVVSDVQGARDWMGY